MAVLETDEERAANRLQSSARIFYIMAVVKVLELLAAVRPPLPSQGAPPQPTRDAFLTGLFIVYGLAVILCIVVGRNLEARKKWARTVAMIYGGLHIGAFFLIGFLGPIAILSGVLGIIALFSVLVASGLGAFDQHPQ